MTKQEQMSLFIKNIRPYLKNRIDKKELQGLTYDDIDKMRINFQETESHGLRPFIDESVVNKLSNDMINDYETIWTSGLLKPDLLH